jgi:hypothetical protein
VALVASSDGPQITNDVILPMTTIVIFEAVIGNEI